MAGVPDPRLAELARVIEPRKTTPAAIRVVEVRGTGPELLGNLRQVDALLVVLDGFSGTRVPADDLETLKLELLIADRDHVGRRLERVVKQAKSGEQSSSRRSPSSSGFSRMSTPAERWRTGPASCRRGSSR